MNYANLDQLPGNVCLSLSLIVATRNALALRGPRFLFILGNHPVKHAYPVVDRLANFGMRSEAA